MSSVAVSRLPMLWRRELWEHRGLWMAPLAAAVLLLLVMAAAAADPCGDCRGNCSAMTFVTPRDMGLCSASNAEGLAIGFDWLYEVLSADERSLVARARARSGVARAVPSANRRPPGPESRDGRDGQPRPQHLQQRRGHGRRRR